MGRLEDLLSQSTFAPSTCKCAEKNETDISEFSDSCRRKTNKDSEENFKNKEDK